MKSTFFFVGVALVVTACVGFGSVVVVAYDDIDTTIEPILVDFPTSESDLDDIITDVRLWIDGDRTCQHRRNDTDLLSFDLIDIEDPGEVIEIFVFDVTIDDPHRDVIIDDVVLEVGGTIPEPHTSTLLLFASALAFRRRR